MNRRLVNILDNVDTNIPIDQFAGNPNEFEVPDEPFSEGKEEWLDPETGITWSRPTAWAYAQVCKANEAKNRLHELSYQLANSLHLILPLAKGYAHQNQVGSNAKYIETAEKALAKSGWTQ